MGASVFLSIFQCNGRKNRSKDSAKSPAIAIKVPRHAAHTPVNEFVRVRTGHFTCYAWSVDFFHSFFFTFGLSGPAHLVNRNRRRLPGRVAVARPPHAHKCSTVRWTCVCVCGVLRGARRALHFQLNLNTSIMCITANYHIFIIILKRSVCVRACTRARAPRQKSHASVSTVNLHTRARAPARSQCVCHT